MSAFRRLRCWWFYVTGQLPTRHSTYAGICLLCGHDTETSRTPQEIPREETTEDSPRRPTTPRCQQCGTPMATDRWHDRTAPNV